MCSKPQQAASTLVKVSRRDFFCPRCTLFPLLVDELCEVASVELINYYGLFCEPTCRRVKVKDDLTG